MVINFRTSETCGRGPNADIHPSPKRSLKSMLEHGLTLMAVGMGTVGAFLTTMVLVMYLTAAILKGRFPDKPKPGAKKAKTKKKTATATKKAQKAVAGKVADKPEQKTQE